MVSTTSRHTHCQLRSTQKAVVPVHVPVFPPLLQALEHLCGELFLIAAGGTARAHTDLDSAPDIRAGEGAPKKLPRAALLLLGSHAQRGSKTRARIKDALTKVSRNLQLFTCELSAPWGGEGEHRGTTPASTQLTHAAGSPNPASVRRRCQRAKGEPWGSQATLGLLPPLLGMPGLARHRSRGAPPEHRKPRLQHFRE